MLPDLPDSFSGLNVLDVNHLQPCQVWNSPHNIRIAGSKFAIDTVSQGALQWQVRHGKSRNKHGIGAQDISKISSIGQLQAFSFDLFGMMPSQNSQPHLRAGSRPWVRATENTKSTNTTPNAFFLAREDGGNVVYGLNYDSKMLGSWN